MLIKWLHHTDRARLVLLVTAIFVADVMGQNYCPPQEAILPCRCSQKGTEIQIWCSHSDLPRVLNGLKSVSKTLNRYVDELILENNFLPSLPGRSISPVHVMRLMLRHNGLERLSSGWLNGLEESLVEIYIVETGLRSVPVDSLTGLRKLEAVTIQSENVKRVPDFSMLPHLKYINVESLSLIELTAHAFRELDALENVQITGSARLNRLEAGIFQNLPNLVTINVSNNGINWIHLRAMSRLPALRTLELSANKISDASMVGRAVKDLNRLEIIKLDHNHVTVLGEGSFVDLPSLKELHLNNNAITEIHHGAFHRIPNLKVVHLERNYLRRVHPESFLQASGSGVEVLHLQYNDIGRIEELRSLLDALPTLKFLDLSYNRLEQVPFGALRGHGTLEQLHLDHNRIGLIERDAFMAMPGLRELRLKNNSLNDQLPGPFWNLPGLKGLDVSDNSLRRLESNFLMGLPSLRRLDASGNGLVSIEPYTFSGTLMLETINVSRNEMLAIHPATFRDLGRLFEVDASQNNLHEMISGLPRAVERVNVRRNKITSLPSAPASKTLDLPNLRLLDLSSNLIQRLPKSTFKGVPQLRVLSLAKNRLQSIDEGSLHGLGRLEMLNVQDNQINSLHERGLQPVTDLRDLNVQGNRIEQLLDNTFATLPLLERLDISHNGIRDISPTAFRTTSGRSALNALDLSNNMLPELPTTLGGLSELRDLDVSFNQLTELAPSILASWRNLEELRASNNKVTHLKHGLFKNLPVLQYLDLSSNEVVSVEPGAIRNLPEIQEIVLADNKLTELPDRAFEDLPSLQAVHLQQNYLHSMGPGVFFRSPSIVYLNLSTNHFRQLNTIGLHSVRNIEVLDLSANGLRRITPGPLRELDWLVELKLDDNQICRVTGDPFATMPRLRVLSMRNNRMSTLPETIFRSVRSNIAVLDLDGNPLDCSCDMLWLRAWLQETNSAYPGPRCRDGTMLRESRLSRSDCQGVEDQQRGNQIPLTNDHGDVFSRALLRKVDECDESLNEDSDEAFPHRTPPSPAESEYFYDQFVEFPANETHSAITNNSIPVNLPATMERPSLQQNQSILNFEQNRFYPPAPTAGSSSPFTFFGMPLPSLNLGKLWGSGRDAKQRGVGTSSRGTGRVQIYRPNDPEIERFFDESQPEFPYHRTPMPGPSPTNNPSDEIRPNRDYEDNRFYYRPYFQTPFRTPSVERGGFMPMMPGSTGGFTPISPNRNEQQGSVNDPEVNGSTENTNTLAWPQEFNERVPLVTEPPPKIASDNRRNVAAARPSPSSLHDRLDVVREKITSEDTNAVEIGASTEHRIFTPTSTTTSVPPPSPVVRLTPQPIWPNQYEHTTTATPPPSTTFSSTTSVALPTLPDAGVKLDEHDLWERPALTHSSSSLSALIAPGSVLPGATAQQSVQNLFRPPSGRPTITKVFTQPPSAEEYLRTTVPSYPSLDTNVGVHDGTQLQSPVIQLTTGQPPAQDDSSGWRKKNMDWYYDNYNKTTMRNFDPGLNWLSSSNSSGSTHSQILISILRALIISLLTFRQII